MATLTAGAIVTAAAVPLTEADRARDAVERFASAAPEQACAMLTAPSRRTLQELGWALETTGCAAAVAQGGSTLPRGDVDLGNARADGVRATVEVDGEPVPVLREGDTWRVDLLSAPRIAWPLRQSLACARYSRIARELGSPPSELEEVLDYLLVLGEAGEAWAADARAVAPPPELRTEHAELLAVLERFTTALGRARNGIAEGEDPKGYELPAQQAALTRAASAAGLRCASA